VTSGNGDEDDDDDEVPDELVTSSEKAGRVVGGRVPSGDSVAERSIA
jgi:hypothetical protein